MCRAARRAAHRAHEADEGHALWVTGLKGYETLFGDQIPVNLQGFCEIGSDCAGSYLLILVPVSVPVLDSEEQYHGQERIAFPRAAGRQTQPRSSSRSGLRSTATGLPSTRHPLQLVEERVEFSLADLRKAIIATGWSQMVRRGILDPEQVVDHGPDVALTCGEARAGRRKGSRRGWGRHVRQAALW